MVIGEFRSKIKDDKNSILATPLLADRFLAIFFDFFLHVPILYLLLATYFRSLSILDAVVVSRKEYFEFLLQSSALIVIVSSFLMAIYLRFWGFTPGKYLMKIRVVSLYKEPLTWGQCLARSFFWWFEVLLLGIPFLEVLSHPYRRPMHDRVAETYSVTLKKSKYETKPLLIESLFIRGMLLGFFFVFMGWVGAFLSAGKEQLVSGQSLVENLKQRGVFCPEIDELASRSLGELRDPAQRVEFASVLFVLEQIDKSCLERELDLASLQKKVQADLIYFGRFLIEDPGSEKAVQYKKLICDVENNQFCRLFSYVDFNLPSERTSVKSESGILEIVLALKQANQQGQSELALNLIQKLQNKGVQATAMVRELGFAYTHQKRWSELESSLMASKSVVSESDFFFVSAELCTEQLQSTCLSRTPACREFSDLLIKNMNLIADPVIGRAAFKTAFCEKDFFVKSNLWGSIEDQDLEDLLMATLKVQQPGRRDEGLWDLRKYISSETRPRELRYDASQVLLSESIQKKDIDFVLNQWSHFGSDRKLILSSLIYFNELSNQKHDPQILKSFKSKINSESPIFQALERSKANENRMPASIRQGQ